MFRRACRDAGLESIWFYDLCRSFVTNARRRGVPESVVMKLSGHRTRSRLTTRVVDQHRDVVGVSVGHGEVWRRIAVEVPHRQERRTSARAKAQRGVEAPTPIAQKHADGVSD